MDRIGFIGLGTMGSAMAANIVRSITAELSFYAQVYGFSPADPIEPVDITFADRLDQRK